MDFEKMTYSRKKVYECKVKVKEFDFSIPKTKAGHCLERLNALGDLFDYCFEKTNDWNFDKEYSCYYYYRKAIFCKSTKKELDKLLLQCKRFLQNELCEIEIAMRTGEVNSED